MDDNFEKNVEAAADLRDSKKKKKADGRKKKAELLVIPAQVPQGEIIPPKVEPKLFDLGKMLREVEALKMLDGDQARSLLEKQLTLLGINTNQSAIETMKQIITEPNDELKSELVKRLAGLGYFQDAITRQRLALDKASFMPSIDEKDGKDPADMSLEEWEKRFRDKLATGGGTRAQ